VRSDSLDVRVVAGRSSAAPGLRQAARLGVRTATNGIRSLVESDESIEVVFDATNALSHAEHAYLLEPLGALIVDLTPSQLGAMIVPTVNGADILTHRDVNMVSCGGQASVPILHAVARRHRVDYIEVVTTAASSSVGHSTRLNLDEYVETTQDAVSAFTGVKDVKALLNLSPARPPAKFRVAMSVLGKDLTAESVRAAVAAAAREVRDFVGGYDVTACSVGNGRAFIAVEVAASGGLVPRYAGNIDIINSAAVRIAEQYAASHPSNAGAETS